MVGFEYGDVSTFFGGLVAKIGAPSAKVEEALLEEHTLRDDSIVPFTTSNYGVTCAAPTTTLRFAPPPIPAIPALLPMTRCQPDRNPRSQDNE